MNNGTTAAAKIGMFHRACHRARAFTCSSVSGVDGPAIAMPFAVHASFPAAAHVGKPTYLAFMSIVAHGE